MGPSIAAATAAKRAASAGASASGGAKASASEHATLVRLLYRSLLRASKRMEHELDRGGQYVRGEMEELKRVVDARGAASLQGTLPSRVRQVFHESEAQRLHRGWTVDAAFRMLRRVNERLPVLQKLVYNNSSNTLTDGVRVKVSSHFLGRDHLGYKFVYNVRINNEGGDAVTLVNREWNIVDLNGRENVVRGPGVVGFQPTILPGKTYEYNSGTPLRTPMGTMWGKYEMVNQQKTEVFEARIEPFALLVPRRDGESSSFVTHSSESAHAHDDDVHDADAAKNDADDEDKDNEYDGDSDRPGAAK